jgi:cellulose synthase (UDP-forming)
MHEPTMKISEKVQLVAWLVLMFGFVLVSFISTTHEAQIILSGLLLIVLLIAYKLSRLASNPVVLHVIRLTVIFISVFFTFRYLNWRATESLPMQFGLLSMICGLLLFLAESYGLINSLLGFFINAQPYHRKPIPLPKDPTALPDVDVYVPTYNEDAAIIRATVIAATQMDYPADKLHVYILDDGGTEQKLGDKDPEKAAIAKARANDLKEIAQRFGAGYITRKKNEHAKAGNINNALGFTSGKLLLILDCDHIPTADFLTNTVGFFLADPNLFVVQTHHNFVSPDPLEKNLDTYNTSPAENELFYDVMQPGLDAWGTSFFCGSAAILRREVLDKLGGIAGQTITEDAETTLDALSLGYSSAYLNRPMVSGLQPETYSGFVIQRVRWGQGMLQIFILKNPWLQPKLSFIQRLLYTNFAFYWGFASSRVIMLLAPPAFLVFSINLCDATAVDLVSYAGPCLIASLISTQYFYGRVRWPFMSQLYEVIQSIYVTLGLVEVLRNPRSPSFKVTPKGEVLDRQFISGLTMPFYFFLALNLAGVIWGVYRYINEPFGQGAVAFVLFWAFLDLVLLLSALGVMLEKRQLRSEPRVLHDEPITLNVGDELVVSGHTRNASAKGVGLTIKGSKEQFAILKSKPTVKVTFHDSDAVLSGQLLSYRRVATDEVQVGLAYDLVSIYDERKAIHIAFGSSKQLIKNNARRHQGRSIIGGLINIFRFGLTYGAEHLRLLTSVISAKLYK